MTPTPKHPSLRRRPAGPGEMPRGSRGDGSRRDAPTALSSRWHRSGHRPWLLWHSYARSGDAEPTAHHLKTEAQGLKSRAVPADGGLSRQKSPPRFPVRFSERRVSIARLLGDRANLTCLRCGSDLVALWGHTATRVGANPRHEPFGTVCCRPDRHIHCRCAECALRCVLTPTGSASQGRG